MAACFFAQIGIHILLCVACDVSIMLTKPSHNLIMPRPSHNLLIAKHIHILLQAKPSHNLIGCLNLLYLNLALCDILMVAIWSNVKVATICHMMIESKYDW
jgi:hypothetical protein